MATSTLSTRTQSQNYGTSSSAEAVQHDPRMLTNLSEIMSCISSLQSAEAELSNSLTELLNSREPILISLARLHGIVPLLDDSRNEALLLSEKVYNTAQTADRVGGRVRSLDEEMHRVREASDRVGQVMELKSSLSALHTSIDSYDWESAARHCARAMTLPLDVISGPFSEMAVPTTESHLPPAVTLQTARETLLSVFLQNFETASRSRDSAATSRFFKLFPSIGWEDEGLEAYAAFVVDLVRTRAPTTAKTSSPLYYITSLTALFESIAIIVDQHQPVVAKYYGPGRMQNVLKRLLDECDRVANGLIEGWEEDRDIKRKLSEISNSPPVPLFSNNRKQHSSRPEESNIEPREIDKILVEIAGMVGRWSLFKKFLSTTLRNDYSEIKDHEANQPLSIIQNVNTLAHSQDHILDAATCNITFNSLLTKHYIPFELWYVRTIIDKAHRLSTPDLTQSPLVNTTPDDVFYILKSVTSRLLSTGSVSGVEEVLHQLQGVMDRDYIGVIKKKLDDVYRNAPSTTNTRGEKAERENRTTFILLLNDLDISSSHLDRLTRDLAESSLIGQYFSDTDRMRVKHYITSFSSLASRFQPTIRAGIEQLFNQLMRPRLRNLIPEVYKDVSYMLTEETYATAEYQDVVRKRFIKAWDSLIDGYKETFSESNYRIFYGLALEVLLRPWERHIMSLKFTELGAMRFDRDFRSITSFLASQTMAGDSREKFIRLQQITTILNLDNEEDVDEFYNGSGINWRLTLQEARSIANLRV
ncbi:COG4 transport protein-domain-containing protein [Crucibulum laeve]|uniref:Conserved oligomeric Golgi complex subunit 4 n=1 Tax=Crucibulum laeve TaxID=68775 RepID=A0A5C3MC03_9AGAR|nr:COG4 transport protein-domain-containing protein [Crucibulum laeve]